jgi:hypothetical protein
VAYQKPLPDSASIASLSHEKIIATVMIAIINGAVATINAINRLAYDMLYLELV